MRKEKTNRRNKTVVRDSFDITFRDQQFDHSIKLSLREGAVLGTGQLQLQLSVDASPRAGQSGRNSRSWRRVAWRARPPPASRRSADTRVRGAGS